MRNLALTLTVLTFLIAAALQISAQSKCDSKDYDCQITENQALIAGDANDVEAYYNLGLALSNKGQYAQAVPMFDKYLSFGSMKDEYKVDGYVARAFANIKLGRKDLAVSDYTKAIGIKPENTEYYEARGRAYKELENYDLAIADLTKAIGAGSKDSTLYFVRGVAYMGQKNNALAIADFTKVMTLEPKEMEAYYNRGTTYYRAKEYAKSVADLDRYIASAPADKALLADGYDNRGLAHFYTGSYIKALDDFTKAIDLAARKATFENRAMAYRKLNKIALAEADEAKAAEMP